MEKELISKKERRKIYLALAKRFEEADILYNNIGQITAFSFIYAGSGSAFVCNCLYHVCQEKKIVVNELVVFPEFGLFKPTQDEIFELEGFESRDISAWWDVENRDVFGKKATALYFCSEMCK